MKTSAPEELEKGLLPAPDIRECLVKEQDKKICAVICCEDASQETVRGFVTQLNPSLPMYQRITTLNSPTAAALQCRRQAGA